MKKTQTREEVLQQLEQKAGDYEELFDSCAQGTLLALQEQFNLGDADTLKASTAMPGVALRGQSCGAIISGIMALGMAMGRDKPEDSKAVLHTIVAARTLCDKFEAKFGSCNCHDVQQHIFGRSFNLMNPKEVEEFAKAAAAKKCRIPVGFAARTVGEMILNHLKRPNI